MDDEEEEIIVPITNDFQRKIAAVFSVFDSSGSKIIDSKDVGTVVRALGCCPLEEDVQELIFKMEDKAKPGTVHLIKFLPIMESTILKHEYEPATPDELLAAFNVLDAEGRGYLTRDQLANIITQNGEAFSQDELEEMLEIAIEPATGNVPYEYYINQLHFEPEEEENNIYMLADRVELEKPPPPTIKRFSQMYSDMAAMQALMAG